MAGIVLVEIAALALLAFGLAGTQPSVATLTRAGVVLALAVGFEEVSRKVAQLRTRLVDTGYVNMTSVFVFSAAISLPLGQALAVCLVLYVYRWFSHQRALGTYGYRKAYSTAVPMLAVAVAHGVIAMAGSLDGDHLAVFAAVAGAAAGFFLTNRLLVFGMICLSEGQLALPTLIGNWSDNALEAATLCLGGLTGLALAGQPALGVLVVLPAYALQRGALVRELEVAASHDPKTGLLNPEAWQTLAKRELSRSDRDEQTATVLIIDLDHFKQVNDSWGHVAGDAVIKAVGQSLREELRDYDSIGRFGGEEFVAILPDVDEFQAAVIAERLRRRVAELSIASIAEATLNPELAANSVETLSASVGVACFPEHGRELDQLLLGADAALYRAKDRGRNRVEFAAGGRGPETSELIRD